VRASGGGTGGARQGAIGTDDPVVAGRYQIEASLGRGGMGEVFLAFDLHLRRQVALKKPRPGTPADGRELPRFIKEARAAAVLSHPNVVAVHDIVVQDGTPYIVMELVPGEPLSATLASRRPLPVDRAVGIARAIASALAYAHTVGVVHRDIKPGNVMLTATGGVKVLDFGIARYLASVTPTDTRVPLGTPEYLAPEQIRGDVVDGRSDVYALGCVLYEMLAGRPPFTGEPVAVAYRHLEGEPSPPSELNALVPHAVDAVVMRCLAKPPDERYPTAGDVEAELRRLDDGVEPSAAPTVAPVVPAVTQDLGGPPTSLLPEIAAERGASPPGPHPARRARRQGRAGLASAVVVALAALVAAAVLGWNQLQSHAAAPPVTRTPPSPTIVLHEPAAVEARGACDGFLRFRAVLSWVPMDPGTADGYSIYRDDGAGGVLSLVAHVGGGSVHGYVDRGLGSSTTYRYLVRATAGSRLGPRSPVVTAETPLLCIS
jgi:hypothetical protein